MHSTHNTSERMNDRQADERTDKYTIITRLHSLKQKNPKESHCETIAITCNALAVCARPRVIVSVQTVYVDVSTVRTKHSRNNSKIFEHLLHYLCLFHIIICVYSSFAKQSRCSSNSRGTLRGVAMIGAHTLQFHMCLQPFFHNEAAQTFVHSL